MSTLSGNIINRFRMGNKVKHIKYSYDGCYIAIASDDILRIFYAPTLFKSIEPFRLYKKYKLSSNIININWSYDHKFILTSHHDHSV